MAQQIDPLLDLITEGKVRTVPYTYTAAPVVVDVDLEALHARIREWCREIWSQHEPLRRRYVGGDADLTAEIDEDIDHMVTFLCRVAYNRLRRVAERYAPSVRTSRLAPRAPCYEKMEFPSYLSSLMQSIGPLRITDGPADLLLIYAPTPGTMRHFGRDRSHSPIEGKYFRLCEALKEIGVAMSPIDMQALDGGSFWTTCEVEDSGDGLVDVVGTFHRSHYTTEDVARSVFLNFHYSSPIFQPLGFRSSYVTSEAAINVLSAAGTALDGIPLGQTASALPVNVMAYFPANYYGLCLADAPQNIARGFYVIGRGMTRQFACYLARNLTDYDQHLILRHRLLK